MTAFRYQQGSLRAEGVSLDEVAAAVGTPLYLYSSQALQQAYRRFAGALAAEGLDALVCYALKANSNQAVIATFAQLGAGADVVSEGELARALAAGVPPQKIVFAGVGKTAGEMAAGLDAGILQFNVESLPELKQLSAVAAARGLSAAVALRINPDVDAGTHEKISTGKAENKFGIPYDQAREAAWLAAELPGIRLEGLAVHIGSQLTELAPYRAAFRRLAELYAALRAEGLPLRRLDLGGGLGLAYREEQPPTPEDYARLARETVGGLGAQLICEPGRHLVGGAGLLLTRVLYVKEGATRSFLIVDAAMNDLIRPTLYEAWHDIVPVKEPAPDAPAGRYDIVGPVCESGDFLAKHRALPPPEAGDLLAIANAGAYGAVMASTYNSRPLVPEVLVKAGSFFVVRPRPSYATLIALDCLPPWLQEQSEESVVSAPPRAAAGG
jgi:diaminopimelate decarboxylase